MPTQQNSIPPERDFPLDHLRLRKQHLVHELRADEGTSPRLGVRVRIRRRYLLAAVVVAAAAIVSTPAFGIMRAVRDLFEGTAPTSLVQQHFVKLSEAVSKLKGPVPAGFRLPLADASKAHGVISVQTTEGPLDLWAAPIGGNRSCWLVQFARDENANNTLYGPSGCAIREPAPTEITWADFPTQAHPSVRILIGQAFGGAVRVDVRLGDGTSLELPVVEEFFLATLDRSATVTQITSYDTQGGELAKSNHGNVVDEAGFQQAETIESNVGSRH